MRYTKKNVTKVTANISTLSYSNIGEVVISAATPTITILDPTNGVWHRFIHDGLGDATIYTTSNSSTPVVTISEDSACLLFSDGIEWYYMYDRYSSSNPLYINNGNINLNYDSSLELNESNQLMVAIASTPTYDYLNIGDVDGGNYFEVGPDGTVILHGSAVTWEDLRIEPVIRNVGTLNPAFEQWFTDGSGSRGVYLYSFTDEHTNEKEINFTAQLPHQWKGTDIYIHVHWIPYATQNSKKVVWGLEYNWANFGVAFGNTTIVTSDTTTSEDVNLIENKHYITEFAKITPTANQNGISSIIIGRIFRNSSDSIEDTYTSKTGLLYIDIHYEIDGFGSRELLVK